MKKVLVVYFSQTGQLSEIIKNMLSPLMESDQVSMVFEAIKPSRPYPFPWTTQQFCNVFPESVQETACELEPFQFDPDETYDLVIIAYTVWYLSPSIPMTSFLQSPEAERVIRGRPVVTIIGCRNMWLLAQERVKKRIYGLGGELTGNIVLTDKTNNLLGVATITYWMMTGKKERFLKILPRPGISDRDITDSQKFGKPLLRALEKETFNLDQDDLNRVGAVSVVPAFIIFENRMIKIFNIWSKFILAKGGPDDPARKPRVRLFFYYLLLAILFLAPAAAFFSLIVRIIKRKKLQEYVRYYSQNTLIDQRK